MSLLWLLQWLNDSEVGSLVCTIGRGSMRGGQAENSRGVELGSAALVLASRGEKKGLVEGCAWVIRAESDEFLEPGWWITGFTKRKTGRHFEPGLGSSRLVPSPDDVKSARYEVINM
jgi:hypothetical protein